MIEAPAKNLLLLPGGGHCAVLMQPAAFLAGLRSCVGGTVNAPSGTCPRISLMCQELRQPSLLGSAYP